MNKSMLCVASAVLVLTASAVDTWVQREGVGVSAASPAGYFDPQNWSASNPPSGSDDAVVVSVDGTQYVSIGSALDVASLFGPNGAMTSPDNPTGPIFVSDKGVTASTFKWAGYYADLNPKSDYTATLQDALVCGDIGYCAFWIYNVHQRLDLYAKSGSETRTNFTTSYNILTTWGDCSICAPHGSDVPVSGTWRMTKESPFLTPVEAGHVLSAGTAVTCEGYLPADTFLKRIFPDGTIEISKPALEGGEAVVSFAAFRPQARQTVSNFYSVNGFGLQLLKYRDEDVLELDVTSVADLGAKEIPFDTRAGYVPGTFILHNVNPAADDTIVRLGTCHLKFAAPTIEGKTAGIPTATVRMMGVNRTARLTAVKDVPARIDDLTSVVGMFVKDGDGELAVGLTRNPASNTGSFVCTDGILTIDCGDVESHVATLAISNGAAVRIVGTLTVDALIVEPGAELIGSGTVIVPSSSAIPAGLVCRETAALRIRGGSGEVMLEMPDAAVVGTPAFWVDMSKPETLGWQDEVNQKVNRINDVRGTGYLFATNAGSYYPTYKPGEKMAGSATGFLKIPWQGVWTVQPVSDTYAPVWSEKLTNIRTVFLVHIANQNYNYSGGQLLGWTAGVGDFHRSFVDDYSGPVFSDTASEKVRNGRFFVNGERREARSGYPYLGNANASWEGFGESTPMVAELHATGDVKADCFAFDGGTAATDGAQQLCECLIYTNELTEAESLAVRRYLMNKWLNCEPSWTRGGMGDAIDELPSSVSLDVAAGETLFAKQVTDDGAFVKKGAGSVIIDDCVAPAASIRVAEGTLVVRSDDLTAASLPTGAFFHLDASLPETMTTNFENGVTSVTEWRDCRPDSTFKVRKTSVSLNYPTLKAVPELGGRTVVDFGDHVVNVSGDHSMDKLMYFSETAKGHSVVGLYGTARGGGQVVAGCVNSDGSGAYLSANGDYGIMRGGTTHGGVSSDPLVSTANAGGTSPYMCADAIRARLNGEAICAIEDGFSGGWDTLSFVSYRNFGCGGLTAVDCNRYSGGQDIAETFYYKYGLSNVQAERIEAYLDKKWRGAEKIGYRPASLASLTVDAGATVRVDGDAPLCVAALSGAGTVQGDLVLTESAVLRVVIKDDGTVDPIAVSGSVDLSNGGTIELVGDVRSLALGEHTLVVSPSLTAGMAGNWTVAATGGKRIFSVVQTDGALKLGVSKYGFMLQVR